MKKIYSVLFFIIFGLTLLNAQRAHVEIIGMGPDRLHSSGLNTNSVSNGLRVFPNETFIYLKAMNILGTQPITTATFTFTEKPAGSNATFASYGTNSAYFQADKKGEYKVNLAIVTSAGNHDTTVSVFAADFVGVGGFDGVAAQYPNCMSCHSSHSNFVAIFDKWKVTGHAQKFKNGINGNPIYYNQSCFKCHTTGYNHDLVASNGGFDDVASQLGWIFYPPVANGKWDTLKTNFPRLSQLANVGCESCHGPGSEHAMGGPKQKIQISYSSNSCIQCHGEAGWYNEVSQWENSVHSSPIWSNSFGQGAASQNNNLQNCIRCHDAEGFVNFTNGKTTNTTGWNQGKQNDIGCPTCHEPHTNNLRNTPAGSDTLGNGFQYTGGGKGRLCMNCHKTRRSETTYARTTVNNANWGPHYSVQTDLYLGQNLAGFGTAYPSTAHNLMLANACVDCHMGASPDSTSPNYNKVGGHTFLFHNPATNFTLTTKCVSCHPGKSSWNDFIVTEDYDGNGILEPVQKEFDNLLKKLKFYLPPVGSEEVSWQQLQTLNDTTFNKAYYNYRVFYADGSRGMHNTKFTLSALRASVLAIGGVLSAENSVEIPLVFNMEQNYPNPFNPTTNITFSLPEASKVTLTIYNIAGKEVAQVVNEHLSAGKHTIKFDGKNLTSGVYLYSLKTEKNTATKKFVLLK